MVEMTVECSVALLEAKLVDVTADNWVGWKELLKVGMKVLLKVEKLVEKWAGKRVDMTVEKKVVEMVELWVANLVDK